MLSLVLFSSFSIAKDCTISDLKKNEGIYASSDKSKDEIVFEIYDGEVYVGALDEKGLSFPVSEKKLKDGVILGLGNNCILIDKKIDSAETIKILNDKEIYLILLDRKMTKIN